MEQGYGDIFLLLFLVILFFLRILIFFQIIPFVVVLIKKVRSKNIIEKCGSILYCLYVPLSVFLGYFAKQLNLCRNETFYELTNYCLKLHWHIVAPILNVILGILILLHPKKKNTILIIKYSIIIIVIIQVITFVYSILI